MEGFITFAAQNSAPEMKKIADIVCVNKMVICVDPEKKKWVDFNGGEV